MKTGEKWVNRLSGVEAEIVALTQRSVVLIQEGVAGEYCVPIDTFERRFKLVPQTKKVWKEVWRDRRIGVTYMGNENYDDDPLSQFIYSPTNHRELVTTVCVEIPA